MQTVNQIIIIEHSQKSFLLLKENLANTSLLINEVIHLQSLKELFQLPSNTTPDLVFLDLDLPDSKGLETFAYVNHFFAQSPVIILSRLDDLESTLQAIQAGAQDYLIKGDFEKKILVRCVQNSIERKKNELALKESENRLRTILDTDPDCIKLLNINCELYEINKAGLAMIEADSFAAVKGKSLLPVIASPYDKIAVNMVKDAFSGIAGQMQFEMNTLKGNKRWCEINIVPYRNADGKINFALGVTRDITQRKAGEEELQRSNDRFLMITSTTNDAVWEWDMETGALWSNENHQQLYGLTINDPVQAVDQWIEKMHPDDRDTILRNRDDVLASQTNTFISEYRFKKTNGDYMNIFDRCYILRNTEGKPIRMTGSMMDITERKKAEEIISRSNERFELIAKTTNDAIWETDLETQRAWGNEMHQRLYGLTLADPVPDHNQWKQRIHPHEREQIIKSLEEAVHSKENILVTEYRFLNGNNEWINIYDRTYILRDEKGKSVRMIGSMTDISGRKKAEEALQQSEEKYRTLVEQASDGIFISDKSGNFYIVNSAGSKMTGYSVEELMHMNIYDLAEPEDLKSNPFHFEEMMNEKGTTTERKMLRKDGTVTDVEVSAKFLSDRRFLAFVKDITNRKKADEELKASYQSIRTLTSHLQNIREEERTHIAREIHDELGQQLTVLKMDLSWLNKKVYHLADEAVKLRMNDILSMLNETVNTVRRISSDLRPSLLDDLGLEVAVEWQLNEFEKRSGIKTSFTTDKTGVKLSKDITIGLFRILQESITNVARHAEATEVNVSLQWISNTVILQITDNGIGFESEVIKSKKTLGILGMQERTVMMGGEYKIKSVTGGGTTVEVIIPIANGSM